MSAKITIINEALEPLGVENCIVLMNGVDSAKELINYNAWFENVYQKQNSIRYRSFAEWLVANNLAPRRDT